MCISHKRNRKIILYKRDKIDYLFQNEAIYNFILNFKKYELQRNN